MSPTSPGGEDDGKDSIQETALPGLRQVVLSQPASWRPAEDLRRRRVQTEVAHREMRRVEQEEQLRLQGGLSEKPRRVGDRCCCRTSVTPFFDIPRKTRLPRTFSPALTPISRSRGDGGTTARNH